MRCSTLPVGCTRRTAAAVGKLSIAGRKGFPAKTESEVFANGASISAVFILTSDS